MPQKNNDFKTKHIEASATSYTKQLSKEGQSLLVRRDTEHYRNYRVERGFMQGNKLYRSKIYLQHALNSNPNITSNA